MRASRSGPSATPTPRVAEAALSSAGRTPDRIDTAPRFTPHDAVRLNTRFAGTDTAAMVRAVLHERLLGRVALVSSFGAESAVLLHLVAAADPATPVMFLDTGKHFAETLEYRDLLARRLGLTDVRILAPDPAALAAKDQTGLRWSYDPDGCCAIRKVAPLAAVMPDFDATITGRKGFQSATRAGLAHFELDRGDTSGRLKFNPLADWDAARIAAYVVQHDLPAHPLVAQGYPSIGCSPCTTKVEAGEDPRSGRWKGWDKTECGIHVPGAADDLPPGYEPAF